ncbi:hypothetical protein [Micromonospora haikouensis]|uniref:Uncharacterized protein n=1 Tax=Micromonospora haikouensis TaxID=686309 RepID=A0A0D0X6D0_9ACTN|nr:hypothetical protein [Micromonospora haikouensis]KIR66726.1 hypothetical protein TK50_04935 [Micromonospora haikouensis]
MTSSPWLATRAQALTERDEQLRAFHAAGWRPVDLQRVTGYSRETIRQALRPEVRRHLDRSGHAEHDLNRPAHLASMYKVVLTEASTVEDLNTWLDADLLRRVWPTLWLPPQLRRRWEEAFPELAATRSNAA